MSTDLLVRKRIEAPVVDNAEQCFARDCRDKLGYHILDHELTSQVIRPLGQVLRELQIEPFDLGSVKDYKTARARSMSTDWACGIPAVSLFFVAIGVLVWGWSTHGWMDCLAISLFTVMGWFIGSVIGILIIGNFTKTTRWQQTWLSRYNGRVPEFALQTALDIRAKCPGADFFIEELRIEQTSADPFLGVFLEQEKYYIEVWNEPDFKARREA